jgi:hypothetical protein
MVTEVTGSEAFGGRRVAKRVPRGAARASGPNRPRLRHHSFEVPSSRVGRASDNGDGGVPDPVTDRYFATIGYFVTVTSRSSGLAQARRPPGRASVAASCPSDGISVRQSRARRLRSGRSIGGRTGGPLPARTTAARTAIPGPRPTVSGHTGPIPGFPTSPVLFSTRKGIFAARLRGKHLSRPSYAMRDAFFVVVRHTGRTDSASRRGRGPLLLEHRVDCGLGTFLPVRA